MPSSIFDAEVTQTIRAMQVAAESPQTRPVRVDGQVRQVPYPFPSPGDWRAAWIYFLMIDRFNNPARPPASTRADPATAWDGKYGFRQGGTFKGVQQQLGYIAGLGARALWLSPVLKNSAPAEWPYNYHGYGAQDFLNVDARFASDGTRATAERELAELIAEAHARGLYVILDIVLNHAARVFDYLWGGQVVPTFQDAALLAGPPGHEPPIRWLDGTGHPQWDDTLPDPAHLGPDDAVWPVDLQRKEFFRRRGQKLGDTPGSDGFVRGDFDALRQLVPEYDAQPPGQESLRARYGRWPVQSILARIHQYLIAKYDVDGFRIDTVKYVAPDAIQTFGNAMREFAISVGKANFFTFGEVADNEDIIARFVGRNSPDGEGFGIDAALDFPLFNTLQSLARGWTPVEELRRVFLQRKQAELGLISSHGEAGRYFVSFLDNHDQPRRFNTPGTPQAQVLLGLGLLFCLQGIPCVYYGTEQGLQGTRDAQGHPTLDSPESVREALWGKPAAFNPAHVLYRHIRQLADLRGREMALRYGRLYMRPVSGNGQDFGHSTGPGGIVAFSRILVDREVLVVANTNPTPGPPWQGFVLVDVDLSQIERTVDVAYSNMGTQGSGPVRAIPQATFHADDGSTSQGPAAALFVILAPMEVQVLAPL